MVRSAFTSTHHGLGYSLQLRCHNLVVLGLKFSKKRHSLIPLVLLLRGWRGGGYGGGGNGGGGGGQSVAGW